MKKYSIFKITMFFWGIGLAMVFHCALPSKAIAYGGPYDAFGINADGSIIAPGGPGYPTLYYNGNQWWPYSPPAYTGPNSYYPYGGFGYQQAYNPYGYGYQQSYNFYGYQQPPYGYYQPLTLANDMVGNGYPTYSNPYGAGYQPSYFQPPFYGNGFGFSPSGYQQSSPYIYQQPYWYWNQEPHLGLVTNGQLYLSSLSYDQIFAGGGPTYQQLYFPRIYVNY